MSSNLSGTLFAVFLVAMAGAGIMLTTGINTIESGSYYPEDVVTVEGRIVRYIPYFDGNRPRSDRQPKSAYGRATSASTAQSTAESTVSQILGSGSRRSHLGFVHFHGSTGPHVREGIAVTIEFVDDKGKQRSIDETWLMPWFGQFELGSTLPVLWAKARPFPESVVKAQTTLNVSVSRAKHAQTLGDAPELRTRKLKELEQILAEYATHYERVDQYKRAYNDPDIDDWTFDNAKATWTAERQLKDK